MARSRTIPGSPCGNGILKSADVTVQWRLIPSALSLATRLFALVLAWRHRIRERNRLRQLDDYMLRDIGLSRTDVERESSKPFWQP